MKTAISLPDELFQVADALATRLGVSRSALYATALAEYVARHEESQVTAGLDRVYERERIIDDGVQRASRRTILRQEW